MSAASGVGRPLALESAVTTIARAFAPGSLDRLVRGVLADALMEGEASFWRQRARQLEAACSQPGDFTGAATPADLAARDAQLREAACACWNRATLARWGGLW